MEATVWNVFGQRSHFVAQLSTVTVCRQRSDIVAQCVDARTLTTSSMCRALRAHQTLVIIGFDFCHWRKDQFHSITRKSVTAYHPPKPPLGFGVHLNRRAATRAPAPCVLRARICTSFTCTGARDTEEQGGTGKPSVHASSVASTLSRVSLSCLYNDNYKCTHLIPIYAWILGMKMKIRK